VLTAHLHKKQSLDWSQDVPPSRAIFKTLLTDMAKTGDWYDSEKLAKYLLFNDGPQFTWAYHRYSDEIWYAANEVRCGDLTCHSKDHGTDQWSPLNAFFYQLYLRPLLNAYCYLFASLGLVAITEKTPEADAVSPYDSLGSVKVTDFGKWCLDVTAKPPSTDSGPFTALADKELYLVTLQGKSKEREVFLDGIGERVGTNRWRISPESFIKTVSDAAGVLTLIDQFKKLICADPAPHWDALFHKVLTRVRWRIQAERRATVYDLSIDKDLAGELLKDPDLAHCANRAEGGLLVVREKDKAAFNALLARHGVVDGKTK
jgi:hypothetical protein